MDCCNERRIYPVYRLFVPDGSVSVLKTQHFKLIVDS